LKTTVATFITWLFLVQYNYNEVLVWLLYSNRALLHEKEFIEGVVSHLMLQLVSLTKDETRAAHLLECLSVLCSFKRIPLKQNQGGCHLQLKNKIVILFRPISFLRNSPSKHFGLI